MDSELLKRLIADQREEHQLKAAYIERTAEEKLNEFSKNKEIIVLTGVRRAGKSILLQHLREKNTEKDYYFNFEDERLVQFTANNFQLLQEVFIELFGLQHIFYFDEIQNIEGWEMFVRRLYNAGYKVYITGSNASLFSEELGTRLTGRYMTLSVYPFSFLELVKYRSSMLLEERILSTTQIGLVKNLFQQYYELGGFPDYIQYQQIDYLHALFEGILYRDIITRYKIPNPKPLKELIFYLASNCSKEMTYNALRKLLRIGSPSTVSEYCAYLESSYLCFFINRYNESVKVQMQSPKKVYFIDHALAKTIGFRFSEDRGRILENIVFIELKRRGLEIYYHKELKECDFILRRHGKIINAIQVCAVLTEKVTQQREIDGLLEAMNRYELREGLILTENEERFFTFEEKNTKTIKIIPIWKWLIQKESI